MNEPKISPVIGFSNTFLFIFPSKLRLGCDCEWSPRVGVVRPELMEGNCLTFGGRKAPESKVKISYIVYRIAVGCEMHNIPP